MVKRQMEAQAAAFASNVVSAAATGALGGPVGMLSAGMQLGMGVAQTAATRAGAERGKQHISLKRWTCRSLDGPTADSASPPIKSARLLGTGPAGDRAARIYEFTVVDAGTGTVMPMKAFVASDSGLPVRLEATTSEGGMAMDYYDFDAPITIALPDCMK